MKVLRGSILLIGFVFYQMGGAVDDPVYSESLLRHHLEKAVVLSGSTGDDSIDEAYFQLLYLYSLFYLQEFTQRVADERKKEYSEQEVNDRIKQLLIMLERAADDCNHHQKVTGSSGINWSDEGVVHQHKSPLCSTISMFHRDILARYAQRVNSTPEEVQEALAHEEYQL